MRLLEGQEGSFTALCLEQVILFLIFLPCLIQFGKCRETEQGTLRNCSDSQIQQAHYLLVTRYTEQTVGY